MIDWILNFQFSSLLGLLLYWLPLSLCAYGYTLRTWINYRTDIKRRNNYAKGYVPTDTLGSLIGRALVTVLPIANLWAAVFSVAPDVFGRFFKWVNRLFNQPLVPKRRNAEDQ